MDRKYRYVVDCSRVSKLYVGITNNHSNEQVGNDIMTSIRTGYIHSEWLVTALPSDCEHINSSF